MSKAATVRSWPQGCLNNKAAPRDTASTAAAAGGFPEAAAGVAAAFTPPTANTHAAGFSMPGVAELAAIDAAGSAPRNATGATADPVHADDLLAAASLWVLSLFKLSICGSCVTLSPPPLLQEPPLLHSLRR